MKFDLNVLKINPVDETEKLIRFIQDEVRKVYRRRGVILGISGGVDSAVVASLAVRAVGSEKVVGLILPEEESSPVSSKYAQKHAKSLGIEHHEIDITQTVDSVGNYSWRDDYIKKIIPEYTPECKYNISLPTDLLDRDAFNFYIIQVKLPSGKVIKKRLKFEEFRVITAFASIKIRARMVYLNWEAERSNLIVAGTTNRSEYLLGDFCKHGDSGTDIELLTGLYKNQVYQLAEYLNVISEIKERTPSPDTFSLPVSDQEFYFRIPFETLDFLLYAWEHNITVSETAKSLGLSGDMVQHAFRDFTSKNRATTHLRELPHTLE